MNQITTGTTEHTATSPPAGVPDRDEFVAWVGRMQRRFDATRGAGRPLFTTMAADGLFDTYLGAMPAENRQYHTCNACRRFVDRFGALAFIRPDGAIEPAFWDEEDALPYYRPAVRAMYARVSKAKVDGVFYSSDTVWGTPETGEWRHFGIRPAAGLVHLSRLQTAGQKTAEKAEDFKTLMRALDEYRREVVEQALLILRADNLYRGEKVLGPVEWLHALIVAREQAEPRNRANVVWQAVATAPAGWTHPRSSMAGTLLDDLLAGLDIETVKRRFADKMHPLQYQRPQAAPTAGNIKRGEEIIAKLGLAASLRRRFARPEDITVRLWSPTAPEPQQPAGSGVFAHLKPKGAPPPMSALVVMPEVTMTWEKFARTMLPEALAIDMSTSHGAVGIGQRANYAALITAEDPAAPPLLQWDHEGQRNPVNWYVWHGGSRPSDFNLPENAWVPLWAITLKPSMWHGGNAHQGRGIVLLAEGCKETRFTGGLALFPETLKSELHEIRATIEAYSRAGQLGNQDGPHACGLMLNDSERWTTRLRVRTKLGTSIVHLDRWD